MLRIRSVKAARFVLFSSFYELEAGVIDSLMSVSPSPLMYPIGPCIPYMTLQEQSAMARAEEDYFTWLDSQPAGSVLYVSLGSFLSVSHSQLAELAMGLAASHVKFLWALRGELHSSVLQLLGDSNGILVPWCDQLKVLCHCSIGGFLTHCGMNSALEAVFAGVPMLTLPIALDQPTNSRLIVDVWKIGFCLKEKMQTEGLIGREEIALAVKNMMSVNASDSKEVGTRANLLKEASCRAIEESGSSYGKIIHNNHQLIIIAHDCC
ncbi:UDP-glycosyltransferase 87A2 [Dichanthelium oligosanthes]|uniref:UDP-glycosyltransferase 87A2 n=1 Tax=Dichanthelium oligosanthes TaxID=888268 RepID=A0A1E5UJG6_9POAL|nr:UDP-glycosyltransferase 87A2 [Dichanthelium oligosanthes]